MDREGGTERNRNEMWGKNNQNVLYTYKKLHLFQQNKITCFRLSKASEVVPLIEI